MKYLRLWVPAIIWMSLIFLFSTQESVQVSEEQILNFLFFKTLHVIEYGILFLLYVRATKNSLVSFFLTIIYEITDEIHQTFIPSREGRLRDVIIDTVGASITWYFLIHVLPKMPKRLRKWAIDWQIT